jgi:hypothetical protein
VKRLVITVTIAALLAALILFGLSDFDISVTDTTIRDIKVTNSINCGGYHSRTC